MAQASVPAGRPRTFAEKLTWLFKTVYPRSQGRPYYAREVAEGIAGQGGSVSVNYLLALRNGTRGDPSLEVAEQIARFFGVSVAFFTGEADRVGGPGGPDRAEPFDVEDYQRKIGLVAALRDAGVEHITARSAGLSPANLGFLSSVIEHLRAQQGLDSELPSPERGAATDW